MKRLLPFLLPLTAAAQTYTATWDFPPADACAYVLPAICSSGYDACLDATNSSAVFSGQPLAIGDAIEGCATMYFGSNGALGTWYWSAPTDSAHAITFTVVAAAPVVVDSFVIRYRSDAMQAGVITVAVDGGSAALLANTGASPFWIDQSIAVNLPAAALVQFVVHADPGSMPSDAWWCDFARVVAHLDGSTGVAEQGPAPLPRGAVAFDVLGRRVSAPAAGVYACGRHRYVILQP